MAWSLAVRKVFGLGGGQDWLPVTSRLAGSWARGSCHVCTLHSSIPHLSPRPGPCGLEEVRPAGGFIP